MASAYTPGLTVSGDLVIRRTRRLPIKGDVLVKKGDAVSPDQVVARALLPGPLQTLRLAEKLGIEPKEAPNLFQLKVGDPIAKGQVVAETKGIFGRFKQTATSDHDGIVESISEITGSVLIREASIPVDVTAYIRGEVAEVLPEEGAIIDTRGAMVQGIFGIGGERCGRLRVAVPSPDHPLRASDILTSDAGAILVGGSGIEAETLKRAVSMGVCGLISGGIWDSDLIDFLGYDIGVAITGQENVGLTLLVTEGFGNLQMAHRTFELLQSLDGMEACINGATQIRAGVIRPEIIVTRATDAPLPTADREAFELKIGAPIRIIREPYFGRLGTVSQLPSALQVLESGTEVRVLHATLTPKADGSAEEVPEEVPEEVIVPRANVELIATQ